LRSEKEERKKATPAQNMKEQKQKRPIDAKTAPMRQSKTLSAKAARSEK